MYCFLWIIPETLIYWRRPGKAMANSETLERRIYFIQTYWQRTWKRRGYMQISFS